MIAAAVVSFVVAEVLFVEKPKEVLVSFELLTVPTEVLAGLSIRVKELIVMSG